MVSRAVTQLYDDVLRPSGLRVTQFSILAAIARAERMPETLLPVVPRRPRPVVPADVRRRVEALRAWRAAAAGRLGLDAGVLLPGRLIERIAEAAPADATSLARVDGVRRWRVDELGAEILAAIATDRGRAGSR